MLVSPPDSSSARAQAGDWLELNTLAAGRFGYGYDNLTGALNLQEHAGELLHEDGSVLEDEILETKYEEFCDDLLAELEWRAGVLGPLYPFEVVRVGPIWRLTRRPSGSADERAAHDVYVLCLLIAGIRYGFLEGPGVPEYGARSPRAFQIVAMLLARGLVGGSSSFWMGSPRPEHDGFAAALGRLVNEMGVGVVKDKPPVSQAGFNKDAGIDVIAWRGFGDRRPTPIVSYGQVASGNDWRNKSVEATLDSHFHHWMSDAPVKYYIPAMYIPFMQHENVRRRLRADFDEVAHDASVVLEKRLGLVLDRLRLVELAPVALPRGVGSDWPLVAEVLRWKAGVLAALRGGSVSAPAA
ncbi:hypothetical protein [Cellulomonas sp. Y8]|uniref:hypothetical protein n=1 Tax=Cellulomonas sp. Y8 TaxID=2591145 RepID=UPI003D7083DF